MSFQDYTEAKKSILESGYWAGKKEESLVKKAEQALGLTFCPSYRDFLLEKGCGDIHGREIYGIISDKFENSSVPNGIWLTLDERQNSDMPGKLIAIAQGYEGYLVLDASRPNAEGEYPVLEWIPGNPDNSDEVNYEDFGAFLLNCVNGE